MGGLINPHKLLKPAPCSLVSSNGFPCQKKEKFLTLTDTEPGSQVPGRATMSICSLFNSKTMTGVLRTSLSFYRSYALRWAVATHCGTITSPNIESSPWNLALEVDTKVVFGSSTSETFNICSKVKQYSILMLALSGVFLHCPAEACLWICHTGCLLCLTRTDGKLFNPTRLGAKSEVQLKCLQEFLFANDTAITTHSSAEDQHLISHFSKACNNCRLKNSLKKT